VLRNLAASEVVDLVTASDIIDEHPPEQVLRLPESSWGAGGGHFTWMNEETAWMWPVIHRCEMAMESLVERFPESSGDPNRVLNQAARELLLLQSSDWPFLVTTGQAKAYAVKRFNEHVERFEAMCSIAESGGEPSAEQMEQVATLEETDNPFPNIDYRAFRARQGRAD
jgi:1,4-alpha-glucan branching enzyme